MQGKMGSSLGVMGNCVGMGVEKVAVLLFNNSSNKPRGL